MLRDYQQRSLDAAIQWINKCIESCVLDLATGAGKSHIVSALAEWIADKSAKRVLCLAPSKELVEQNREKFLKTGKPASMYSGSAGRKCLKHNVVFGTEKTVLNGIEKFGDDFAAVIIDECHKITPTIKKIIAHLKANNPKLRVIGLTATPYRLGSGYIYQYKEDGTPVLEDEAREPYFNRLVCRVPPHELIEKGYLTEPHADPDVIAQYDTSELETDKFGRFTKQSEEKAYEGRGRLTSQIVADIVEKSRGRAGVIIFAATKQHAEEVMESLPKGNARLITGANSKKEREDAVRDFKAQKFKYLVNIQVFTTGFDATHIDVVAILRRTESVSLLQQMIGRGLRLHDGKDDCLVLDYAENIETHCPDGDLFNPQIKVTGGTGDSEPAEFTCPMCSVTNLFKLRPNPDGFDIDENGYYLDLEGDKVPVNEEETVFMPAHYGRRCFGQSIIKGGAMKRCEYRWAHKVCDDCGHENDIAARFCEKCKGELVDPNEKLKSDFAKIKRDPKTPTIDKVLSWRVQPWVSQRGKDCLKVEYTTEYRTMAIYYMPEKSSEWFNLCRATLPEQVSNVSRYMDYVNDFQATMPRNIKAAKVAGTKFYDIIGHNYEDTEVAEELRMYGIQG